LGLAKGKLPLLTPFHILGLVFNLDYPWLEVIKEGLLKEGKKVIEFWLGGVNFLILGIRD